MFCQKCGAKNENNSKFCAICGGQLHINLQISNNGTNNNIINRKSNSVSDQQFDRDFKNHPWTNKLGGFLAFLVYGNYATAFISALSLTISSIFTFALSIDLFKAMTDYRAQLNALKNQIPISGSIFSYDQLKYLNYTDITGNIAAYILCLAFLLLFAAICIFIIHFSLARNIQYRRIKFLNKYYIWIFILFLIIILYVIMSMAFTAGIKDMTNRQPKVDLSGLTSLTYIDFSSLTYIVNFCSMIISLLFSVIIFTVYVCNSKRLRLYMRTNLYLKNCIFTKHINTDKLIQGIYDDNIKLEHDYYEVFSNNFCSICGAKLSENIMFCPKCDNKIQ